MDPTNVRMKSWVHGKVMTFFFRDRTEKFRKLLQIEKTMKFCVSGKVMIIFLRGEWLMIQIRECPGASSGKQV